MVVLVLFNMGNVYMFKVRKYVFILEDNFNELLFKLVYEWIKKEYIKVGMRYEEVCKIKFDFYEVYFVFG